MLPYDYFNDCLKLEKVSFDSNRLLVMPEVHHLRETLVQLHLSGNCFHSISRLAHAELPRLQLLSLSENRLETFDFAGIERWPELQYLYLRDNRLTTVSDLTMVTTENASRGGREVYLYLSGKTQ